MKKLLISITIILSILCTGCTNESSVYFMSGRYYTDGTVITDDGNIWGYSQDIISDEPSYNDEPIIALMDDNGTPEVITDDIIIGVVFDSMIGGVKIEY